MDKKVASKAQPASVSAKKPSAAAAKSSDKKVAAKKTTDNKVRSKSAVKVNAVVGGKTDLKRSVSETKTTVKATKSKSGTLAGSKRPAAKSATKLAPQLKASGTKAAATKKPKRK